MDKIIYHYTTIKQSLLIIESGFIKVSEWERKNNVKPPALWLSLNPLWENTATKMTKNIFGETVSLSFEEQYIQFGCARFLIEFNKDKKSFVFILILLYIHATLPDQYQLIFIFILIF